MGWARLRGPSSRETASRLRKKSGLRNMVRSLTRRQCGLVIKRFQLLAGNACVDDVEPWIDAERGLQSHFGYACLPQPACDHAGVEKQESIPCAGAQRVLARVARFLVFSVLV